MILKQAIEHYGVENQLNKVDEELKELREALDNWRKDKTKFPELIDEIADVMIMVQQLRIIILQYDDIAHKRINDRIIFTLDRLKQRIEDDKNKSRLIQKD